MFLWIKQSFKRQIIFAIVSITLILSMAFSLKIYSGEKEKLEKILETQVSQLVYNFSLSISNKVFYKNYFELSDDLLALYNYNQESASNLGALFKIKNIAILDKEEKILAHSDPVNNSIGMKYTHIFKINMNAKDYSLELIWNKEKKLLSIKKNVYLSSEKIGCIIMVIDPIFFKDTLESTLKNMFIVFAVFIFVLIIFSIYFARFIDKPFLEIMQKFENIGEGKLDFTYSLERKDEFHHLAKVIKEADLRIYKQKEELLSIQKGLEKTVENRTSELVEKADKLSESINNLKRAQKQLVETEKMSALGSLVAGIAHEINTPIGVSITGITYINGETKKVLQLMETDKLKKTSLEAYLNTVETASKSMHLSLMNAAKLINSFKQVAIDQHTEDKRSFNLSEYIDEVLLSLHNKIKHEPITLEIDIDKNIQITSYAGIFYQMITNFIMNSIIHAFVDKTKQYNIFIKAYIEDEYLYFIYEDDGKGIDEKDMKRIFDPFFTTKLGHGGSGLGLNIIYNLINHKLKGEIACASKEQGITMTVKIPLKELEYVV